MRTNLLVAFICGLAGAAAIAMTAIASAQQSGAPTLVLPTPTQPAPVPSTTRAPQLSLPEPVAVPRTEPSPSAVAAPRALPTVDPGRAGWAPAPSTAPSPGFAPGTVMPGGVPYAAEPPTVRRVIALKSVPANDLAQTLTAAFKTDQFGGPMMPGALPARRPTIIADAVSNCLVVCASRGEMEEIVRLVDMLDQPPSLVYVEVVLARMARPKAAAASPIAVPPTAAPSGTAAKAPAVKPDAPAAKAVEAKSLPAERPAAVATPAPKPPAISTPTAPPTAPKAIVVPPDARPPVRRENPFAPRPGERPAYPVDRYTALAGAAPQRMADVLARLNSDPNVVAFYHVNLATLHNQPAYAQFGRREPRVTGSQVSSFGTTRNVNIENVGQLVRLTPRVSPDGAVTMEIDVEASDVARETEGVVISESRDGRQDRVQPIQTSILQTTVAVREGQVVALAGMNARRGDGTEQIVCYVTARAVRIGEGVRLPDGQRRAVPRRLPLSEQPAEERAAPDAPRRSEGRGRADTPSRGASSPRSGRAPRGESVPTPEPVRPPR